MTTTTKFKYFAQVQLTLSDYIKMLPFQKTQHFANATDDIRWNIDGGNNVCSHTADSFPGSQIVHDRNKSGHYLSQFTCPYFRLS